MNKPQNSYVDWPDSVADAGTDERLDYLITAIVELARNQRQIEARQRVARMHDPRCFGSPDECDCWLIR